MQPEQKYLNEINRYFQTSPDDEEVFLRIARATSEQREQILRDVSELTGRQGLAYGLLALYRQQVNCGFVLADPLGRKGKESKQFEDDAAGVKFRLLWNPDRELRKSHSLLIERGVINKSADKTKLINIDEDGKPCYLCSENIAELNPAEALFGLRLAGEDYFAGANFAYIENNHFTIMSSQHREQAYEKSVLAAMADFVEQTDGYFRAIFNGRAGATILRHLHLQATTEAFPVEEIRIDKRDVVLEKESLRISRPFYYTPVWVLEGTDKDEVIDAADDIIMRWHKQNEREHTENVIAVKADGLLRMFIFLRDTRRLAGAGKSGPMACFECGGDIVLSYQPSSGKADETDERKTFDTADLATVKKLLGSIAPAVSGAGC